MDPINPAPDGDNNNTNQYEAPPASRCVLMMDQFEEATFLTPDKKAPSLNREVNLSPENTSFYQTLPTIIITPSSPDTFHGGNIFGGVSNLNPIQQSANESCALGQDTGTDVPSLAGVGLLSTPHNDITKNIPRPPVIDTDNSCAAALSRQQGACGESNREDDIEVTCRFSSTPVMSRKLHSIDANECSMISINDASPIPPDTSITTTPNRSSNRSIIHEDEDNEDSASTSTPPQNILYVHPQYLLQSHGQAIYRRDIPVSQNSETCMGGRVLEPGYLPTASMSVGAFSNSQNVYSAYMQPNGWGSDFFPSRETSWTDLSYPSETPTPSLSEAQIDTCCYPVSSSSSADASEYFVYPSIYVSSSGLISVLLRNDMSVEMTVDRTIRVVSHNHMMAVATDSRGTAACLYHPAVKVLQMGTATDIATTNFRARMGNDVIAFSNGVNFFRLEDYELQPTAPIKFIDICRDQSVNLLFSSEGYGESLVASCMQVAAQAEYANLPKGGVIVRINGVKVTQTGGGDVTVNTGAKFIKLSPHFGTTRLGNRFVDIEVEKDWTVKLTRGSHSFIYSKKRATVCNGKMEAGFDENNGLKVTNLQLRLPLLAEPSIVRRPCRKQIRIPPTSGTPKRRPGPANNGRGSGMM